MGAVHLEKQGDLAKISGRAPPWFASLPATAKYVILRQFFACIGSVPKCQVFHGRTPFQTNPLS